MAGRARASKNAREYAYARLAAQRHKGGQVELVEVVLLLADRLEVVGRHALRAVPVEGLVELRAVLLEHLPHLVHLGGVEVVALVVVVGLDDEVHQPVLAAAQPVGIEGHVATSVRLVKALRVGPPAGGQ